jgi:hypothetical protein
MVSCSTKFDVVVISWRAPLASLVGTTSKNVSTRPLAWMVLVSGGAAARPGKIDRATASVQCQARQPVPWREPHRLPLLAGRVSSLLLDLLEDEPPLA